MIIQGLVKNPHSILGATMRAAAANAGANSIPEDEEVGLSTAVGSAKHPAVHTRTVDLESATAPEQRQISVTLPGVAGYGTELRED